MDIHAANFIRFDYLSKKDILLYTLRIESSCMWYLPLKTPKQNENNKNKTLTYIQ